MKSAEESAPRIKVLISSKGTEACSRDGLPDTGADINLMSEDWTTDIGLKVNKRDKVKVVAADGEFLKILGSVMVQLDQAFHFAPPK